MPSHSDIDLLIATLHPHILQRLFKSSLLPSYTLEPGKDTTEFRKLLQAFATLFSFYPGCDSAAITAQAHLSKSEVTSLYICLSPSTPDGFDKHANQWLSRFMSLRREYQLSGDTQPRDTFSRMEKHLILDTYRLCYPSMRQCTISRALQDWKIFANVTMADPTADISTMRPTEEDISLWHEHRDKLQELSRLVQTFVTIISGDTVPEGEDVLGFHKLCLSIHKTMTSGGIRDYIEDYAYPGSVAPLLEYMCLPIELSILLDLSRTQNLAFDGTWLSHVLDPLAGARQFNAAVTKKNLVERFGEVQEIKWDDVVHVFQEFILRRQDDESGYEWKMSKNLLSTSGPVTVHPEITLIQHLLDPDNIKKQGEAYMACSRTPCYASVLYAGVVNQTLNKQFTMHVNHPDWCRLYTAEPWILPEFARADVISDMKELLLRDLKKLMRQWTKEKPYRGYSVSTK